MRPIVLLLALAAGCASGQPEARPQPPLVEDEPAAAAAEKAPAVARTISVDLASVDPSTLNERAPETFAVEFATTEGTFVVELTREWAPNGVDRFYNLVRAGYYTDVAAFRVIDGFMAQFGIHGDPGVNENWQEATIPDDPPHDISNRAGLVSFAMAGPNTRTVQLFINTVDNGRLDPMGFTPIGRVRAGGLEVVTNWYSGYGEGAPMGQGPDQGQIQAQGNAYLREEFPKLSYIESVTILGDEAP